MPTFGDRFCGKGSHLSKAAGLRGFDIEEPLDWNLAGCDWDFRTEAGKPRLEVREADGSLLRTHGAPEIWTFFGSSVVRASVTNEIVGTTGHLGSATPDPPQAPRTTQSTMPWTSGRQMRWQRKRSKGYLKPTREVASPLWGTHMTLFSGSYQK